MNSKTLLPLVGLALALAVAGCKKPEKLSHTSTFQPPAGPMTLAIKWTPGESVVQRMDMKTLTDISMPGQNQTMQQDMSMGQKYSLKVVKETPGGGHEVEMEFLSARMAMEMGGRKLMDYDSTQAAGDEKTNPVAGFFGKIVGSKIKYELDASNNVTAIQGVTELTDKLMKGQPAMVAAPLKSMFGEGYFKQLMDSSKFLPDHPVAPGDSWPVQLKYPMDMLGTLVLDYTFHFQGWEKHGPRECARLEFSGTVKTETGTATKSLGLGMEIQDGTTSGTSWFDPELGLIIDTAVNQEITMVVTMPNRSRGKSEQPQSVTTKIHQDINIKLDSVK